MVINFDDIDAMNNSCTVHFTAGDSDIEKDLIIESMQLEQDRIEAKIANPLIVTTSSDIKLKDKIIYYLDRIENQLVDDTTLIEVNRKELKTWIECLNQFCTKQDITLDEKEDSLLIMQKIDTHMIDMYLRP